MNYHPLRISSRGRFPAEKEASLTKKCKTPPGYQRFISSDSGEDVFVNEAGDTLHPRDLFQDYDENPDALYGPNALDLVAYEDHALSSVALVRSSASHQRRPMRTDEIRSAIVNGVLALHSRLGLYHEAHRQATKAARDFEDETRPQVDIILNARKQLSSQERNYKRRFGELQSFIDGANSSAEWLNWQRENLLELGAQLSAIGTEYDKRSLRALGIGSERTAVSVRDWIKYQAAISLRKSPAVERVGLAPVDLKFDVYHVAGRIDWPRGVEERSTFALFAQEAESWIPDPDKTLPADSAYLKLVQLVSAEVPTPQNASFDSHFSSEKSAVEGVMVVYRFLLVDRMNFGRKAMIVDGVLLPREAEDSAGDSSCFTLRYWPSSHCSVYTSPPDPPTLEMPLVGATISAAVDSIAGSARFMHSRDLLSSPSARLNSLATNVIQKTMLIGEECCVCPDWESPATYFSMPLEYGDALRSMHRPECAVVGQYCSFRALVTGIDFIQSVEILIRERSTNQLVWMNFSPELVETMRASARTVSDGQCIDHCLCQESFSRQLELLGQSVGSEAIQRTIESTGAATSEPEWRSLERIPLAERQELLAERSLLVVTTAPRLGVSVDGDLVPASVEAPASRKRKFEGTGDAESIKQARTSSRTVHSEPLPQTHGLTPEDREMLSRVHFSALDENGSVDTWKSHVSKRRCGLCGMLGANNKAHFKYNHGQKMELSQEQLLVWWRSLLDGDERDSLMRAVQK